MKLEVIRRLKSDKGTYFYKGDEVYFTYEEKKYIGTIEVFTEHYLTLKNITVNGTTVDRMELFRLDDIGNCSHVRYDYM